MEIKVFYIDMRAFGKGFEDLYMRSRRLGVKYIRGLPGTVEENDNNGLRVAVENTTSQDEFARRSFREPRAEKPEIEDCQRFADAANWLYEYIIIWSM